MIRSSSFSTLIFVLILGIGVGSAVALYGAALNPHTMAVGGIVPSTVVETMQLGGMAGLTALTMGIGQEQAIREKAQALAQREGASDAS